MTREEELEKQGWQRRFTADEPRLSEAAHQYEEIGFEILLEPVAPESQDCTTCLTDPASRDRYRTIYTRSR
jgi:hypothetical protein